MLFPPVLTKTDFVRRYAAHEFGNASPTWNDLREWLNDGHDTNQLFHIRNRVASGVTHYNIPSHLVKQCWNTMLETGVPEDSLYISAMAPTELTLFQGEVQRQVGGLYLFYTTVAKPMRDALKEQAREARGIMAYALLRHYLCPCSYEWLMVLLDRYPDHVVEFSVYAREWGTIPGYNTVFWECRKY